MSASTQCVWLCELSRVSSSFGQLLPIVPGRFTGHSRPMKRLLLLVLATGACAQAHQDSLTGRPDSGLHVTDSSGGSAGDDGSGGQMVDAAPHIDSPVGGGTQ